MPRPKDKIKLLELVQENFSKLLDYVEHFSQEEQQKDFTEDNTLNRNIRDVLCHLHHWHLMFIEWYKVGMTGGKPIIPSKNYTWKTLPLLNKEIQSMYCKTDLQLAKKQFNESFKKILEIIQSHTNEELFTKKKYHWTGSTSLGSYLISSTSSHYDWALKLVKKGKNNSKNPFF